MTCVCGQTGRAWMAGMCKRLRSKNISSTWEWPRRTLGACCGKSSKQGVLAGSVIATETDRPSFYSSGLLQVETPDRAGSKKGILEVSRPWGKVSPPRFCPVGLFGILGFQPAAPVQSTGISATDV